MPVCNVTYLNSKIEFEDPRPDLKEDQKCNLFNWNTLYKVNVKKDNSLDILEKITDSPDLIENCKYVLFYEENNI